MSFQPLVPAGGVIGWNFLNRTLSDQKLTYQNAPEITRDTDYFAENIGKIDTPEALVSDRRLLRVALGAFGLKDDINSKALIQKVLEGGSLDPESLANRMADTRYFDLTAAFGFDFGTPSTKISSFAGEIVDAYRAQKFEIAVGDQDEDMRLALFAQRQLAEFVEGDSAEDTKLLRILGNAPMRQVIQTALGLPSSFTQIDLETQIDVFKEKLRSHLNINSVSELENEATREKVIEQFLLRSQIRDIQVSSAGSIALILLQGG